MQTGADYRRFAEECRRLAKTAKTEQRRGVLEEMAKAWMELADEAEWKGARDSR
jgi:hypothetical protein